MVLGLLAGEGWLVLNLVQQNGRLLVRLEAVEAHLDRGNTGPAMGLPTGSPAPSFELSGLDGKLHTLDTLRAPGNPVLLFFVDPDCGPCNALLLETSPWHRLLATTLRLTILT